LLAILLYSAYMTKYFLVAYLLADNDKLTVRAAIKKSIQLTIGHRFSILLYGLSFIGWFLLTVLCLPLIFFTAPYIKTSFAMYAHYLIEKSLAGVPARFEEPVTPIKMTQEFSRSPVLPSTGTRPDEYSTMRIETAGEPVKLEWKNMSASSEEALLSAERPPSIPAEPPLPPNSSLIPPKPLPTPSEDTFAKPFVSPPEVLSSPAELPPELPKVPAVEPLPAPIKATPFPVNPMQPTPKAPFTAQLPPPLPEAYPAPAQPLMPPAEAYPAPVQPLSPLPETHPAPVQPQPPLPEVYPAPTQPPLTTPAEAYPAPEQPPQAHTEAPPQNPPVADPKHQRWPYI